MKTKIIENPETTMQYPCLMRGTTNKGLVVLAIKRGGVHGPDRFQGVTVSSSEGFEIGEWLDNWNRESFEPFEGTLELSN